MFYIFIINNNFLNSLIKDIFLNITKKGFVPKILKKREIWQWASLCYFTFIFYVVFIAYRKILPISEGRPLELIPLVRKINYIVFGNHVSSFKGPYSFYIDFIGNFFLFIPFPFCLFLLTNIYKSGKILIIAFFSSILIEAIQYIFRIGVADIDDVILNTLGAFAGIFIIKNSLLKQEMNESNNKVLKD